MHTIQTNTQPTAAQGIALYLDAGWGNETDYADKEKTFEKAYQNSHFILAKENEKLIGMIRYFTDGFHDTQIIECLVLKAYQRQGVATAMLNKLKELHPQTAIYVESTETNQDFFFKQNFKKSHLIGLSFLKQKE